MKKRIPNQTEYGQSLLELALVLVLLLILLAGVVDLGRMMYEYLTMRDAAQEGAGYGAVFPNDCARIIDRVKQNLPDDTYAVNVEIEGLPCGDAYDKDYSEGNKPKYGCGGKTLSVIIEHDSPITMPFLSPFINPLDPPKTIAMRVVIEDRIVRPACVE